jgi:hypothetical protein
MAKPLETMIEDHILLWLRWIACDKKVRDLSLPISERKKSAQECEKIVNDKYASIKEIDDYYDRILKRA